MDAVDDAIAQLWRRPGVSTRAQDNDGGDAVDLATTELFPGRAAAQLQAHATRDAASNVSGNENAKQRRPRTAPKGTKLPPSSAPPLPAALSVPPAALGRAQRRRSATGAAV